jgi:hypothetical protein
MLFSGYEIDKKSMKTEKMCQKVRDANTENSNLHYHTNYANRSSLHCTIRKNKQNHFKNCHVKMQSVKLC